VQENSKAFGCANWKSGCRFTLWKNALIKAGGPMINQRIIKALLTEGQVVGSTGAIRIADSKLSFYPKGAQRPAYVAPLAYEAKKTAGNAQ